MRCYYIHKDKTVEFFGNHPVVDAVTLKEIVYTLDSMLDIPTLTDEENEALNDEADWHEGTDDLYDNAKQDGL